MATLDAGARPATARRGGFSPLRRQETIAGYLFLLPNILGFLVFSSIPVVATFTISLLDWDLIRRAAIRRHRQLRQTADRRCRVPQGALFNTGYYVLGTVPAGIILSLLLALAMNANVRGIAFFRAVFFIPVISASVAVAMMWRWLYNTDFGLINLVLTSIGLTAIPWLSSTAWAMPAVIMMAIWKSLGYNMVIFLAGLQSIPAHLHEAAAIDGANSCPALPLHHPAAAGADHLLRPGDLGHQLVPGVRPGVRADQGRPRRRHQHDGHVHLQPGVPVLPHGVRRRRSPGCCSRSSSSSRCSSISFRSAGSTTSMS